MICPVALKTEQILGDAIQAGDAPLDFIVSDNYYQWYYHIGKIKEPHVIVEFGVRYGYSAISMCRGANESGIHPVVFLWDCELDIPGSLEIAAKNVLKYATNVTTFKEDTKNIHKPPRIFADIVHVDGDHSDAGVIAELRMADHFIWRSGWILVDDTNDKNIREITEKFAADRNYSILRVPTLRGMIIVKPEPFS